MKLDKSTEVTGDEKLAPAEGWRYSWTFITALFALASFVEAMGFGHLGAFTPLYLRELGVDAGDVPRWTGYLAAASFIIGLPLAPFWGVWADKYSRKMIIVRSAVGEAAIFGVAALAGSVWQLLISRMLVGFILGNTGVMYAYTSSVAPKRQWGLALAIIGLGSTVGMSLGPLLGGYVVTHWDIRTLLLLDGALSVLTALTMTFFLKESKAEGKNSGSTLQMLVALGRTVLGMRAVKVLFASYAVVLLGAQISMPFVPILVEKLYAGPDLPSAIGLVSAGFAISTAALTTIWGKLGDWLGPRRILTIAVILLIPTLAVQATASDLNQLLLWRVAQGACQAAITPLLMALVALSIPEERRASILNLSLFPNYFAWIVGSAAGAMLASYSLQSVFLAGAFAALVGLAMLVALVPRDTSVGDSLP